MSHIVQIQTEVRDLASILSACRRLKLPQPTEGTFKLFSSEAIGVGVQLPDWRYPVVCETSTGKLRYDNYGGRWGDPVHLGHFLQAYGVERATLEARRNGYAVLEEAMADGAIRLTVQVKEHA